MARTKTNTKNDTKTRTTSWRNRHLEKLYFCVFRIFLIHNFLNELSKKCWVTALVRSMNFIGSGSLNQFWAIANLTLSQQFLEKKKKEKCIYSLQPGHLEAEQNDRKVKEVKLNRNGWKRGISKYKRLLSVKFITGPWQSGQC